MKVKEAIEWLKITKRESMGYEGKGYSEVINLIEELNKYKQMWEELEETDMNIDSPIVNDTMYYMKKKYFPKEG